MTSRSSTGVERPQPESSTPPCSTMTDDIQTPSASGPDPQYPGQEQGKEEGSVPKDQPQDGPSSPGSAQEQGEKETSEHQDKPQDDPSSPSSAQQQEEEGNHAPGDQPQDGSSPSSSGEDKEMVITSIQAKEPALGLRRLPAGFYTVVRHSGHEWRTENKRSSVNDNVVEWRGPIPLPSDRSATVALEVYASFEFQPMLGTGEHLRKLTITMDQLLDRSTKHVPFTLFPKNGDMVSPCSSILVTVKQRNGESSDSSASRVLGPICSTTETLNELEDATNHGHSALSRYRKDGEKRDLEHSVAEFERALNNCPVDHPCRAAAQSNLAMAKLILCRVKDTIASLEIPIRLCRDALAARPVGHTDRPSTLVQLAAVHLARFEKQRDNVDGAQVETLLHEAMELSATDSDENRVVSVMLQLYAGHRFGPDHASSQSSVDLHSSSHLIDEDPWSSSVQLLKRFQRHGDLADLQRAITLLRQLVRSVSVWDDRYRVGLGSLGVALELRFEHLGELRDLEDAISTLRDAVHLTPDGHPDKPGRLDNLGLSFITRFERLGELRDLEDAISTHRDAVHLTPDGHPDKLRYLNNLGLSFITRFERLGELRDLEDAISTHRDAVHLTPDGHPDKPGRLNNLGNSFRARFERLGELRDLEDAISTHRDAVHLTPDGHPDKLHYLNNLGLSFITRFERLGELRDLEDAISTHRDAVHLTPDGHPDKPGRLNNLGNSFRARFERLGELRDLEDAISTHRDAVHLTPDGHPDKLTCLHNLGLSFITRFLRLGELRDLEDAISTHRDSVHLTPDGHPDKPGRLNNLGNSFRARFERLGELRDLEDAISTHRDAVHLTPDGHPDKPTCLYNLGNSFTARFERLGELRDLEDAISTHRDGVHLTPDGHPDKPGRLNSLGNSFRARFERLGELRDLEDAISTHRDAVHLTPDGHPDKPGRLNNLGKSFRARFERLGELRDLEDAISTHRDGVHLTPDGHPDKPGHMNNLGLSFITRFLHLGELRDLEDAISTHRDAVHLTPDGHPDKPGFLSNLGNSFRARFERLGELRDLEDAISTHRDGVHLTPDGHPDKPGHMNNLGNSFTARFLRLGELRDLEDAISTHRDAVHLTPDSHPNKPGRMNNLGNSFRARFERLGELRDLEDAISTHRDGVHLTPDGHPDKPTCLNNLGLSFITRFKRLGELRDLEDAISTHRDAVHLTPDGHPDKPGFLSNLGNSFITRFLRLGELRDLEDAISTHRDGVHLTPDGHPDKLCYLNNLGNSFRARFDRIGELRDLEDAISTHRDAVHLTPDGHPDKLRYLNNLGLSFITRFLRLRELRDLEDAISTHRDALHLTPDGHPDKPGFLNNLGDSFRARFLRLGELRDLEAAISLYSHAASVSIGPISDRFSASRNWILCAPRIHHPSLLRAYSIAINLLPQLAWIGLSLTHRYAELRRGVDVREAAAAALDSGFPELAVEWLEQGRSIVWGELLQLRGSYEQLSSAHPDHAHRLRELSAALDDAGATREKPLSTFSESTDDPIHRATQTLQQVVDTHRTLAIERDKLLQDIRRLPDFNRFLLPKDFSQLRASAHSGPVVVLNAAERRCDALIVLANVDHVIHVPLPNFTFQRSIDLQGILKSFLRCTLVERTGQVERWDRGTWETFLSPLWKCVVEPVMDALAFSTPGDLSRIFWCPTGPFVFLPIHAAGLYDAEYSAPGHKVFDFVVSSYVPTLSILAPSRNIYVAHNDDFRLLAVRQPPTDGRQLSRLPGVHTELKHIKEIITNTASGCATFLEPSVGTVEEVLGLMKEADWVHFACHGIQDARNPTDSGLCLANERRLKISDIIGLSRSRGGLAFLSACQTATGDEGLSDEAIHIAAGMLFAGYAGVIGTMWSISDTLAPIVAKDVYEHLFRNGTRPDYREAAWALHEAIGRQRDGEVSFNEWVPFIHVGL
ncbi:CHAT domain-containing protein [Boletus edulis BED1]|uniref:CHAT domain-containing protein n=1 Tax=Boletus edulis BED1 TaxID=1328754 RepID=A0AAD4BL20_BOLED|nr:CHAT domain-containing protein [Boletus edulis BED1]